MATACKHKETRRNTGSLNGDRATAINWAPRESQAGPSGVAERLVGPMKPGNAGRGKRAQLKGNARSDKDEEIGAVIRDE